MKAKHATAAALLALLFLVLVIQAVQKSTFKFYGGDTTGVMVWNGDHFFCLQARWADAYLLDAAGKQRPCYFESQTNVRVSDRPEQL